MIIYFNYNKKNPTKLYIHNDLFIALFKDAPFIYQNDPINTISRIYGLTVVLTDIVGVYVE